MKNLLVMFITLLLLDLIYLHFLTPHFSSLVKKIQKSELKLNMISGFLCYLVMAFSLYYFIIRENKSALDAGILGCCIYLVFELTNKALFIDWSWITVFIELVWGFTLFYVSTQIIYYLQNKM